MLTVSGAGRIGLTTQSEPTDHITQPGEVLLIRPDTPHDYGTARRTRSWELLWTHFLPRPYWQEFLNWSELAPGILSVRFDREEEAYTQLLKALGTMHQRARSGLPRRAEFAMNALEEALLWCETVNPRAVSAGYDSRIALAVNFLRENLPQNFSVGEVAKQVGLSLSRFARLFREQVGETPQQFVERERIARAQELLLLTGRSITAIAEEVGYENPFYFTLRFRKRTGVSPREWRKLSRQ
jgi:AraC family transcriptional regulator of arabinose operon